MQSRNEPQDLFCTILYYGKDILTCTDMLSGKTIRHHKQVSVYEHSLGVAYYSLLLARKLPFSFHEKELVRGALLHDFYLYDWHVEEDWHRFHGFRHPFFAHKNANSHFVLSPIEKDIILKHMFPLTPIPPRYKESILICITDKLCSLFDLLSHPYIPNSLLKLVDKKVHKQHTT